MAEFLVRITVAMPTDLDAACVPSRRGRARAGPRLVQDGSIVRIWRVPGTTNNVGVWRAGDASALCTPAAFVPRRAWCRST